LKLKLISNSPQETEKFGEKLAEFLKKNNCRSKVIALYGNLGMGKTAFARGFMRDFGFKGIVNSPTFNILHEYCIENIVIYHFDMYRINSLEDLESTGFFEYIDNSILIIEWSENIENFLCKDVIKVKFSLGENILERNIILEGIENFESFSV